MDTFEELRRVARSFGPKRVAVVLAHDEVVLEALDIAKKEGLITPTLIGDIEKVKMLANKIGYDYIGDKLIDESDSNVAAQIAVRLVKDREVDLIMKGKVQTADLIKAVIDSENGIRSNRRLSQVLVLHSPVFNRFMLLSDAAINISPTLAQKADICRNAITVAHAIGIDTPKLVALTALELVNETMPATLDAYELKLMNLRNEISGAIVDGPLALDVPLDAIAAKKKGINSPVAGEADILIGPNIEASNILYRAILYFGQARSAGVIMGASVPLIHLSRADNVDTKVNSIALAIIVGNSNE